MASPIPPITHAPLPDAIGPKHGPAKTGGFQDLLESSIRSVEQMRSAASSSVDQFLGGEQEDPHTVALATERAELAFDLFLQVRNKVVQAYQEVMRMQI